MTDVTFNQSQMDEIAAMMNAIEPGAGANDGQAVAEVAAQVSMASGLELFALAVVLCAVAAMSVPYVRAKALTAWRGFRQAYSFKAQ